MVRSRSVPSRLPARRATIADAPELTRLRRLMLLAMGTDPAGFDPAWEETAVAHFRNRLSEPDRFAAFVVDAPDRDGLAASAVGWIDRHLPSPGNPSGEVGYIASMSTDPRWRRRGHARAGLLALLGWMRERGLVVAELHATADGEPLYRSLGFTPPRTGALRLRLR